MHSHQASPATATPSRSTRRPHPARWAGLIGAILLIGDVLPKAAQGQDLDALERFALADDRWTALERLLPGSEEHSQLTALLLLQEGRFAEYDRHMEEWAARSKAITPHDGLEARRELLGFESDPERTWAWLLKYLRPNLDHPAPTRAAAEGRPTRLDPAKIADSVFLATDLGGSGADYRRVGQAALRRVEPSRLGNTQLRQWLGALSVPDLPGLVPHIARDLGNAPQLSFGGHGLHLRLSLQQLDELWRLRPDVIEREIFVETYLRRLVPEPASMWRTDTAERGRYLERLDAFTARLNPSFDSLRAHALHHLLAHEVSQGRVDEGRLLAYLRLPRVAEYTHPARINERPREFGRVELGRHFPTELPAVGDDRAFVRELLLQALRGREDLGPFAPLLHQSYGVRVLAEANLLAGLGDPVKWFDMVGEESFLRFIENRVDLRFAPTVRTHYAPDERVVLELDLKNVPTLAVRIFELDAFSYLRAHNREPDTGIDLEGFVPNHERIERYDEAPLLRHRRRFEFPELDRPGLYVVEFAAGSVASRALVRKGELHMHERLGSAGHVLRIFDWNGQALRDARAWIGDREFAPDERGEILVPFTSERARRNVILRHGDLASLAEFQHLPEEYQLAAGMLLDREHLVAPGRAELVLRPELRMHGQPVSLRLLEEPRLRITLRRHDGVVSALERTGLELDGRTEYTTDFPVPDGLKSVSARLIGYVRSLEDGERTLLLSEPTTWSINRAAAGGAALASLLLREGDDYVLEVRGRDGEPIPSKPTDVVFSHPDHGAVLRVQLATDERGRIELGPIGHLRGIVVRGIAPDPEEWQLTRPDVRWPVAWHGVEGEDLRLPFPLGARSGRAELTLFGTHSGVDRRSHLSVSEGEVVLRGLPAGDFTLWSAHLGEVQIRIAPARTWPGLSIDASRNLELSERSLPALRAAAWEGDDLVLRLAHAGEDTRVHLIARRYLAPWDGREALEGSPLPPPRFEPSVPSDSLYSAERTVGDEQRYIYARRFLQRFPGNLLERPGLVLQPWSPALTSAAPPPSTAPIESDARSAGRAGRRGVGRATQRVEEVPGTWADLDFLAEAAQVIANLRPDEDGVLRIPRTDFAPEGSARSHVEVLVVHGRGALRHEIALQPGELRSRTRAREQALPEGPLVEHLGLDIVRAGEVLPAGRGQAPGGATLARLSDLWRVLRVLVDADPLDRFAFLLDWPDADQEKKLGLWSEHASHELHVFLHFKDRPFFDSVVRPYLANRGERSFLDAWLLEEDVRPWLRPDRFEALNLTERVFLLERLGRDPETVGRELGWLLDRNPPPAGQSRMQFETALAVATLESEPVRVSSEVPSTQVQPLGPSGPPASRLGGPLVTGAPAASGGWRGPGDTVVPGAGSRAEEDMLRNLSSLGYNGGGAALEVDAARRVRAPRLHRDLDPTRVWEETYWWRRPLDQGSPPTAGIAFWLDYALRERGAPFLSPHVLGAIGSASEVLLALAVSDLAFGTEEDSLDEPDEEGARRARRPLLVAERRLETAPLHAGESGLLAAASLYLPASGTRAAGRAKDQDLSTDMVFEVGTVYGLRVLLTNTASEAVRADLLLALPEGAFALDGAPALRGLTVEVPAFGNHAVRALFYFPRAGRFEHRPGHVSIAGEVVSSLSNATLEVLDEAPEVDPWRRIAARGSLDEVIDYLGSADLVRSDPLAVAWRLSDKQSFERILAVLRERLTYRHELWAYALLHKDPVAAREYLEQAGPLRESLAPWFRSSLMDIDPFLDGRLRRQDFAPLVLPRAHPFGNDHPIRDEDLRSRYRELLAVWMLKPALDDRDRVELVQHLFLQGRLEEALQHLERIDPENLIERLQYDYLATWAAFLTSDHGRARSLAEAHREHPSSRWRKLFAEALDVLDRAEGRAVPEARPGAVEDRHALDREPVLELAMEGGRVRLDHFGLDAIDLSFHAVDVEFQFSRDPFGSFDASGAGYVRPHARERLELDGSRGETFAPLPEGLSGRALVVRAEGGGLVRSVLHQPGRLAVELHESRGHLIVRDGPGGRALAAVYVKVYARDPDGSVRFHKDGYTDLLGRFDYVSLSNVPTRATRFALLVLDDERGSTVRQAAAPTR